MNSNKLVATENVSFELLSLSHAVRYQRWIFDTIAPYLGARILEVGAGIGNMSQWLPVRERLILTELDPHLLSVLDATEKAHLDRQNDVSLQEKVSVKKLDLLQDDLGWLEREQVDTIISFNVLEHIEQDQEFLQKLVHLLDKSQSKGPKRLISFVPAHSWAYGSMDRTFGHFRRYSAGTLKKMCREVAPGANVHTQYFNTVGLLGWVLNGKVLKKDQIGQDAIAVFERICPVVRVFDHVLHQWLKLPLGQSLLCVLEISS